MTRKTLACLAVVTAALALVPASLAGRQGGAIRGRVIDPQGFPVNGAYIYVTSPAQPGVRTFITGESGFFGFLEVGPGLYKVTVEMPGFKTVSVQDIRIEPGATVKIDLKLEAAEVEEEKVARGPVPAVDPVSPRLTNVLDRDLLARIPLPRDFTAILGLVPGLIFDGDTPTAKAAVLGLTTSANEFSVDRVDVTDPIAQTPLLRVNVDAIETVEVESAGHPAIAGPAQGALVNVVQRSGGNHTSAALSYAFTGSAFSRFLWSADELSALSLAAPVSEMSRNDVSFTWGGPLVQDMVWFFTDLRYVSRTTSVPFKNWTDPLHVSNQEYLFHDRDLSGLFKLSMRVFQKYQGLVEVGFSGIHQPVYENDLAWNRPLSTTRDMRSATSFLARAQVVYTLAQGTVADIGIGYFTYRQPLYLNGAGSGKPQYFDLATGRTFGSGPYNELEERKRLRARAAVISLQGRILGMSHELSAGAEYETMNGNSSVWKTDDLVMYYLSGSPYTFGTGVSPVSGSTVGVGLIGFSVAPSVEGALDVHRDNTRLGFFAQDLMTIAGRATLSLGLRFDRTFVSFPAIGKGATGNPISITVGDSLIGPVFSLNPFRPANLPGWDDAITWNSLSPRAGLSVDLLGTGKTFLRASYSRLPETLSLGYSRLLDPFPVDRVHQFLWYDENGDGLVDAKDNYALVLFNYGLYLPEVYRQRVDAAMKAPVLDEWTAGLDQQVSRTVSLSARYISRTEKNVVGDVLYDPASGRPWYSAQNSPAGWWIPFSTTVPGTDGYPATPVTVYFPSTTAPAQFDRVQNVPELGRKFRGLELTAHKRMSDNWQLAGSFVWGRSTGTANLAYPLSMGLSMPALTPNSLVNVTSGSRTDLDRPFALRVMGTYRFPLDFYLSFYYRWTSGAPWARTVTVVPPAAWAAENGAGTTPVTVYLESPGSRRFPARQNADLRLEKEFLSAGRARFSVYMDVLNVFGNRYKITDLNDGGFWAPDGVGGSTGIRTPSGTYGQAIGVLGTRAFLFRVSLIF